MILKTASLGCGRAGKQILSGVSIEVEAGACWILRGPNGSGKTTLLRCLAGLSDPMSGQLNVNSEDVAYSGHLDAVKAALSVQENLNFWASLYQAKLATLDADLRLDGLKDRLAGRLSAGQKRRLGLARMILSGSKLWLLDEPTNSLDTEMTNIFVRILKSHLETGGAAILSTHLDLDIPGANVLNLSDFQASQTQSTSPFLDGEWS